MMRVIGGNARGRRLKVPKGQSVRPTSGRVKEALFNILPRDLSGIKLLDLFAGTGNVSIEAISRGAAEAILIDSSVESGKVIRENLRRLRFTDRTRVWIIPVFRALRLLARRGESFDMIFLDPPYERNWIDASLEMIAQGSLLRSSGTLIVEHSAREQVNSDYGALVMDDQRNYSGTLLSFFKHKAITTSAE
ncbi:MAG: 16S rRNA (guanine(966)-N(2))-methyltransferase RsmD [Deltaproteobacteria bacterium]|nr:16S rRNA (guanine(966)-N(2))-methyltransferase RsmD [Deltaproteobacteria bacterium]